MLAARDDSPSTRDSSPGLGEQAADEQAERHLAAALAAAKDSGPGFFARPRRGGRHGTLLPVRDLSPSAREREHAAAVEAEDDQAIGEFRAFLIGRYGSVVKAWRKELDPNCLGELLFPETVEALARIGWHGDTSALWGALVRRAVAKEEDAALRLSLIAPNEARLAEEFRRWASDTFGGAIEMFRRLTGSRSLSTPLLPAQFQDACTEFGFKGDSAKVFSEILDRDSAGTVSLTEMVFVEDDALKRKAVLDPDFASTLAAAKATGRSLRRRKRTQLLTREACVREFRQRVRAHSGGSFVRGFRRILDLDGNLAVSKVELLKGVKRLAFEGDVMTLWKAMDIDGDDMVYLHEVDNQCMALVLASFKKWTASTFTSAEAAMQHFAALLKKRSSAKWSCEEFAAALAAANFPGVFRCPHISLRHSAVMLHEAFDVRDVGYITAQDVAFIDKWVPTPWLIAEPDFDEKTRFIAALRQRFPNLVIAWRKLLDKRDVNRVAYEDFNELAKNLRMQNPAGLWRALDDDDSGFISLTEIDRASSDSVLGFKAWAEHTFGTLQLAFRVLDTTRTGSISLPILRRSLRDFKYPGDAKTLFQNLRCDVGSNRRRERDGRLVLDDLRYLLTWETNANPHEIPSDDSSGGEESPRSPGGRSARSRRSRSVASDNGSPSNGRLPPMPAEVQPPSASTMFRVKPGMGLTQTEGLTERRRLLAPAPPAPPPPGPPGASLLFCKNRADYVGFVKATSASASRSVNFGHLDRRRPPPPTSPYDRPAYSVSEKKVATGGKAPGGRQEELRLPNAMGLRTALPVRQHLTSGSAGGGADGRRFYSSGIGKLSSSTSLPALPHNTAPQLSASTSLPFLAQNTAPRRAAAEQAARALMLPDVVVGGRPATILE